MTPLAAMWWRHVRRVLPPSRFIFELKHACPSPPTGLAQDFLAGQQADGASAGAAQKLHRRQMQCVHITSKEAFEMFAGAGLYGRAAGRAQAGFLEALVQIGTATQQPSPHSPHWRRGLQILPQDFMAGLQAEHRRVKEALAQASMAAQQHSLHADRLVGKRDVILGTMPSEDSPQQATIFTVCQQKQ